VVTDEGAICCRGRWFVGCEKTQADRGSSVSGCHGNARTCTTDVRTCPPRCAEAELKGCNEQRRH